DNAPPGGDVPEADRRVTCLNRRCPGSMAALPGPAGAAADAPAHERRRHVLERSRKRAVREWSRRCRRGPRPGPPSGLDRMAAEACTTMPRRRIAYDDRRRELLASAPVSPGLHS